MADRVAKDALFDAFAEVGRALANGRRAEIVDVLAQGERSVDEVAGEIDQSMANTSQHLRALARAGLVAARRDGNRIYYRLADDRVTALWAAMREVAADHVAGLDRLAAAYLGDRSEIASVTRDQLAGRLGTARSLVVLDIRPTPEFIAGHIPGARSVPPDEMGDRLKVLGRGSEAVAYCRGPYCAYADEAVRAMRRRGVRAFRLEDGFPEWRRAGLPVASGAETEERV